MKNLADKALGTTSPGMTVLGEIMNQLNAEIGAPGEMPLNPLSAAKTHITETDLRFFDARRKPLKIMDDISMQKSLSNNPISKKILWL
jgi:hypothetical protein